ncbi:MAG: hypothetical protein CSA94_02430 [Bacteroidetes bacterium]|nr:MAG: hypothetical protein CSA94_02430 [Bacteroidota bacterium]
MNYDIDYTLTATRNNCVKTVVINISDDSLGCNEDNDGDGVLKKNDPDDTNPCIPGIPNPIVEGINSCTEKASAVIRNYDPNTQYSTSPFAIINGAEITGMDYDKSYLLTAKKNSCEKMMRFYISKDNLDCDGDGVTNETEKRDGTDPENPCDYKLEHQTVAPSAEWKALDCNNDCTAFAKTLTIPQFLTPNNDGDNDAWEIPELAKNVLCNQENRVMLFNVRGAKVFDAKNYMKDLSRLFRGYSSNGLTFKGGKLLPSGAYFYIIELNGKKGRTGYMYIVK